MPEIKKFYLQKLPAMRFVGKRYGDEDRINDTFSNKWSEWFENNLFAPLKLDEKENELFDDCNAYYGLCRCKKGEPFQYWIGVFLPVDASVPEGYESVCLEAGEIAVNWIYGKEPDIYSYCCLNQIAEKGFEWTHDSNGVSWCFERYVCPRFSVPDESGNVILDMCFYVKEKKTV